MNGAIRPDELQRIRKLTEVSRALTYAATLDEVFQLTVDRAADLLGAEAALVMVANDDGRLALRAAHGVAPGLAGLFHEPLSETLVPRLAALLGAQPESFLGVPLVVAGAIKGILVVIRPSGVAAAESHDEWLLSALADQAALALEKTHLDEIGAFREELMAIVGHDLRSPLSTVLMSAGLLLRSERLDPHDRELATKITRNASRAVRLIGELLDLTRSRLGGGIPVDPAPCDLGDVCRQVRGEIELTDPERPLRLEIRGDPRGVWDRDRLSQLVGNLVVNAIQHGEPRTAIDVRIDGEAEHVVLEVGNRGEPIPALELPHVFEAFRQGRRDHPGRRRGLGLGLFIAHEIARAHRGAIAVSSSARDGTTVRVRLPRGTVAAT